MTSWQIVLIVVVAVIAALLLFFFGNGYIFHDYIFKRKKDDKKFAENEDPTIKNSPIRNWFFGNNLEEISIRAHDDLILKGYLLNNNSNKLVIICHDYHERYYSSCYQAKIFFENGYDVFMPNNRGHDTSAGFWCTMGPKETFDLLRWINLMIKRNPNYEIVLYGVSMGAHIVMMTSGRKVLPINVKCFIADSGYASLRDEIEIRLNLNMPKANKLLPLWLGNSYCKLVHRFSLNDDTKDVLPNTKIPGLFIHGDKDKYVPISNLDKNYNYMSQNVYHEKSVFEGAQHNQAINDYEKYRDVVINFVNKFVK